MKKLLDWLRESNRWKHLLGGLVLGLLANGWYCALLCGASVGGALELKDRQWGGRPDCVDFLLTLVSCIVSYSLKHVLL